MVTRVCRSSSFSAASNLLLPGMTTVHQKAEGDDETSSSRRRRKRLRCPRIITRRRSSSSLSSSSLLFRLGICIIIVAPVIIIAAAAAAAASEDDSDSSAIQQQQQLKPQTLHCEVLNAADNNDSSNDDPADADAANNADSTSSSSSPSVISCQFILSNAISTAFDNEHHDMKFCIDLDDMDDDDDDDDDDEIESRQFCIEAKVTPTVTSTRQSSSSSSSSSKKEEPTSQSQSTTTTADTKQKKSDHSYDSTTSSRRMVNYDPKTGTVQVGDNVKYERPYNQYGYDVALALVERVDETRNKLEFGTWLYALGLAHSAQGTTAVESTTTSSSSNTDDNMNELKMALNAFGLAQIIFENINSEWENNAEFETMTDYAKYQLACVYFQMSETYTLLGNTDGSSGIEYMIKAERLFRSMFEENLDHHDAAFAQRVRGYAQSQDQAEQTWATSLLRLGILTLDKVDTSTFQIDTDSLNALMESKGVQGSTDELKRLIENEENDSEATRVFGSELKSNLQFVLNSEKYFDDAGKIYSAGLDRAAKTKTDDKRITELKWELAMTYQNKVTATTVRADIVAIINNGENAIKYYKDVLNGSKKKKGKIDDDDDDDDDEDDYNETALSIIDHMASIYYLLSDSYLQMGMYDEASYSFEESMKIHEKYDLNPPDNAAAASSTGSSDDDLTGDETIASYEKVLEDYQSKVRDDPSLLDDFASSEGVVLDNSGNAAIYYYDRNDGYEGDLYAALGSIYLDKGDRVQAEVHLSRAVVLYERSIASGGGGGGDEEGDDESGSSSSIDNVKETRSALADTKYNLAILRSRNRQFMDAAKSFRESLDMYKDTVGVGENPVKRRLADLSNRISSAQSVNMKPVVAGSGGGGETNNDEQEEDKAPSGGGGETADLSDYWTEFKSSLGQNDTLGDEL